jgi:hypothetical protein
LSQGTTAAAAGGGGGGGAGFRLELIEDILGGVKVAHFLETVQRHIHKSVFKGVADLYVEQRK